MLAAATAAAATWIGGGIISHGVLVGSLAGAWLGAGWATRMHSRTRYRVLALLLVLIAVVLAVSHSGHVGALELPTPARVGVIVLARVGIGIVAALMGVAGGELLIPTIVLMFGVDIKVAGSLSLVSAVKVWRHQWTVAPPIGPRPHRRR